MAKQKYIYVCTSCGHEEPKWMGRCPECGNWNTFQEQKVSLQKNSAAERKKEKSQNPVSLIDINSISQDAPFRISSGITELDEVLGGGIVRGSAVLIGGEPGIGKSTLMLQLLASVGRTQKTLYVSGEESPRQIKHRAERLGLNTQGLKLLCETRLESLLGHLRKVTPEIVVIDSVQTLVSEDAGPIPGTVNQIKFGCLELIDWAKEQEAAIFFVGHVTKEGNIAGPKLVEHMVDTVLYFEQGETGVRLLRAAKNRFGSVDEIGIFTMESHGLIPVEDPFSFFLTQRAGKLPPGITFSVVFEGTRAYVVEIQALTVESKGAYSRIFADKVDNGLVARVAAVMEKHLNMEFAKQDIYINVAGGIRLKEVSIELPLALALYSARSGKPLSKSVASSGELSLAGEIRPISHMEKRIKSAVDLGMKRVVGPNNLKRTNVYFPCAHLDDAVTAAFSSKPGDTDE